MNNRFEVDILLNGKYLLHKNLTEKNPKGGFIELNKEQYKKFISISRPCVVFEYRERKKVNPFFENIFGDKPFKSVSIVNYL
jgi:hypothetical protein